VRPGRERTASNELIRTEVDRSRGIGYRELLLLRKPQHRTVEGASGMTYAITSQAFWDDPRHPGDLRVTVSVREEGSSGRSDAVGDFIVRPDGTFVGE